MYEHQTYEDILNRALEQVPDNIDKRQGSIIYDALAPACIEIAQMYVQLDNILKLTFANSSSGEFLDKRCDEIGITRKPATKAVGKGTFTGAILPLGSRFNYSDLTYRVTDNSGGMDNIILECEEAGSVGNHYNVNLVPITEIPELESAELVSITIPGEDEESDEDLLKRFNTRVKKSSTSGNVSHYIEWTNEVEGMGAVRTIPKWNGSNSIKLLIVDSDMQPASDALVQNVQDYIDPNSEGLGYGQAPIGAYCTVAKADSVIINISADISGVQAVDIEAIFREKLEDYFKELITNDWQTQNSYKVSYAKIGALLLETIGEASGDDYANLMLNSSIESIELNHQIPMVGTVTFNDATQ